MQCTVELYRIYWHGSIQSKQHNICMSSITIYKVKAEGGGIYAIGMRINSIDSSISNCYQLPNKNVRLGPAPAQFYSKSLLLETTSNHKYITH